MKSKIAKTPLNFITYISISMASFIAYYILLEDRPFHLSISHIILMSNSLDLCEHLLVLGILPIYISLVIFGAAILGFYIGRFITYYLSRLLP